MAQRILFVGGGSAGHSIPCVAVSEAVAERRPDAEFLFIGATREVDRALFERLGLPHRLIDAQPFPYSLSPALVKAYLTLRRVRKVARAIIDEFSPDVTFSTGGFVSAPVVPEARRAGVPIVLHAADARPGRANLALARHADTVTVAYEASVDRIRGKNVICTGQPVRRAILHASRERGRAQLGIPEDAHLLLAIGGSQGADTINRALVDALPQLLRMPNFQAVHFTGLTHVERYRSATSGLEAAPGSGYQCHGFFEEPGDIFAAADILISRCGSSSMAEIATVGAPCIAVPYPHAGGHQRLNVEHLEEAEAAVVIDDAHLSGGTLGGLVVQLLSDPDRLAAMSEAAKAQARPGAADQIAELLLKHLPPS